MIRTDELAWVFSTENSKRPLTRDFIWTKRMLPYLKPIGLDWATFQVMRRTHASRSKEAGVDAHTRSAQMGNTVDVNENEYAVSDFKTRREAVRKLEAAVTVKVKDNGESSKGEALQNRGYRGFWRCLARGRCNALQPAPLI
jgi:integrase